MKEQLRLVRTLLEKQSARRKVDQFVVEGPHLVETAAAAGQIDFVIYAKSSALIPKLEKIGIACFKVSDKEFAKLSDVETPQGILAVVKKRKVLLSEIVTVAKALIVVAIEVQDPGNLGTIIRSADAVGATGVVVSRGTVDPYNSKVVRSTMGSIFHLPIIESDDIEVALGSLRQNKITIVAADIKARQDYFMADFKRPVAILVGNEAAGLGDEIVEHSDQVVKIPMPGKAESLNVGVATSLLLYEALRQRTYGTN